MNQDLKFQLRILFLVVVVFITVGLAALFAAIATYKPSTGSRVTIPADEVTRFETDTLQLTAKYDKGSWVYSGKIDKPSPCHKLSHTLAPDSTNVRLDVSITAPAADVVCAMVIQTEEFSGSLATSSDGEFLLFFAGEELKAN